MLINMTLEDRAKHAIAAKIPDNVWLEYFNSMFDKDKLPQSGSVLSANSRSNFPQNTRQALVVLLIAYPDLSPEEFLIFARNTLNANTEEIFDICVAMNKPAILDQLKQQITIQELKRSFKAVLYSGFTSAAANGHEAVLAWYKQVVPEELAIMAGLNKFSAISEAAINGHLQVLKWFKNEIPNTTNLMLKNRYADVLEKIAQKGDLEVITWIQDQAPDLIKIMFHSIFQGAARYGHLDILNWVKKEDPTHINEMIFHDNYRVFMDAAENGQNEVLDWLVAQDLLALDEMIRSINYSAFIRAAENGHIETLEWFKKHSPNELTAMLQASSMVTLSVSTSGISTGFTTGMANYAGFINAAANGHLEVLKWYKEQEPENFYKMLQESNYCAFRRACEMGHLDIVEWLTEQAPHLIGEMIQAENAEAIFIAVRNGKQNIMDWFMQNAPHEFNSSMHDSGILACNFAAIYGHINSLEVFKKMFPEDVPLMIHSRNNFIFNKSAERGHLNILEWVKVQVPNEIMNMLGLDNYQLVFQAIANGKLEILQWLQQQDKAVINKALNVRADNALVLACSNGHVQTLKWLMEQEPDLVKNAIYFKKQEAFQDAARNGHLEVLKWLAEHVPDQLQSLIEYGGYSAFVSACENNHLDVVYWLQEQQPNMIDNLVAKRNYSVYQRALANGHHHIINHLLHNPQFLAVADGDPGCAVPINRFKQEFMDILHQQHDEIRDPKQATVCFYLIRNIIRRNDRAYDNELAYLLQIPAVRQLAHQEITKGQTNELYKLACKIGNLPAATQLLTIPTVQMASQEIDLIMADDKTKFGLPSRIYPKFYAEINQAINEYNTASAQDKDSKIKALKKMQEALKYVDFEVSPNRLASATQFHQIESNLFILIKLAYAQYGVDTLLAEGSENTLVAKIISDMSPQKADQLMSVLLLGDKDMTDKVQLKIYHGLINLYDQKDTSVEAHMWADFLKKYSLEFLGGGNSRNYKVTEIGTNKSQVLKLDLRLGMPRRVEYYLRTKLSGVFPPTHALRQVLNNKVAGTLIVTNLYPKGSLAEHSATMRKKLAPKELEMALFKKAASIMSQMTQILIDLQQVNCCFTDAKWTNWLLDAHYKIHIADTKSFVFIANGVYSQTLAENADLGIIQSSGFSPVELLSNSSFNADNLHASLLGRNIYAYLTGDTPDPINLSNPVFSSQIGGKYAKLITDLIVFEPANRMSLNAALKTLQQLDAQLNSVEPPKVSGMGLFSKTTSTTDAELKTSLTKKI
ncbi:MAG: ankyrin repeat domain-containing protein [Legionella sp.]|jgi:hypothetical protein